MTNKQIRGEALDKLMGNFWRLAALLALTSLLLGLTKGLLELVGGKLWWVLGGAAFAEDSALATILSGWMYLITFLCFAPCILGVCREIMEIYRGNAPSVSRAFRWFGDSYKSSRAWKFMRHLFVKVAQIELAVLAIQLFAAFALRTEWYGMEALLCASDKLLQYTPQGNLFSLIGALVKIAKPLILLWFIPSFFLQAAELRQAPADTINASTQMVRRRYGSFFCLLLVISLQAFVAYALYYLVAMAVISLSELTAFFILAIFLLIGGAISGYAGLAVYRWVCNEQPDASLEIVD